MEVKLSLLSHSQVITFAGQMKKNIQIISSVLVTLMLMLGEGQVNAQITQEETASILQLNTITQRCHF